MPTTYKPHLPDGIRSLHDWMVKLPVAEEWPLATEEELLDFANKVREAGGGDVIPALLPSDPGAPNACLIANALNFGCSIMGHSLPDSVERDRDKAFYIFDDEGRVIGSRWGMRLHDWELAAKIADVLDLPYHHDTIFLPTEIGNAAGAFDAGRAFQNYVIDPEDS